MLRKKISMAMAVVLSTSFLAVGGTQSASAAKATASPAGKLPPLELSFITQFNGVEFPQKGNEIQNKIEAYTNTKIDFRGYPNSTINELLPTLFASGDLPDLTGFGITQMPKSFMQNGLRSGMFWDIAPYVKDYKNLSSIPQRVFDTYAIDGKVYGVPKLLPPARETFMYRKDWADKLGIAEPKTLDDMYNMILKFTTMDPNGSGKQDTYGVTMNPIYFPFAMYHGAPNSWAIVDGKFVKEQETQEYMDSLKKAKELYDKKAVHPEWAIMNTSQWTGLWTEGKVGVYRLQSNITNNVETLKKLDPKADVYQVSLLEGPKGIRTSGNAGHNSPILISKKRLKTEADLKRVLQFFNQLAEPEMANLMQWGIEGKHYNLVDGKAKRIDNMLADYNDKIFIPYTTNMMPLRSESFAIPGMLDPIQQRILDINEMNEKYAVYDPSLGLDSDTFVLRNSELQKILDDARVKFIMGEINEDKYWAEIKRWKTSGGDKMAQEYADAYKKSGRK